MEKLIILVIIFFFIPFLAFAAGANALPVGHSNYTKPFSDEMKAGNFKNIQSVEEMIKNAEKTSFYNKAERLKYTSANEHYSPSPSFIERKKMAGKS